MKFKLCMVNVVVTPIEAPFAFPASVLPWRDACGDPAFSRWKPRGWKPHRIRKEEAMTQTPSNDVAAPSAEGFGEGMSARKAKRALLGIEIPRDELAF